MKIIEQTNRTIVFEKFSDEKYNILTLIDFFRIASFKVDTYKNPNCN